MKASDQLTRGLDLMVVRRPRWVSQLYETFLMMVLHVCSILVAKSLKDLFWGR
jgi:hypothetical protein